MFTTITARLGTYDWGVAEDVNRFSNPEAFCKSLSCGVDRNDIAAGADAVFSMNKTRHLVSALTDSVFPVAPEALEDKLTVTVTQNQALEILQTAIEPAVFQNEFVTIQVDITNTSGVTLNNLDVSFAHLSGGLFSVEPQTYENSFASCRILGSDLIITGLQVGDAQQKIGALTCFIEQLAEDENITFSYRLLIDDSPPILNGDRYYHELVTVNNIAQLESEMCVPVFADLIDALGGNTACDNVQIIIPGVDPGLIIDLDESPTITGSKLTLPFIRLSGGELIRAEFMVVFNAEVELQMVASSALDPLLTPTVEATYDELSGLLFIGSLQVGTGFYEVQATYVLDSDPVIFTGLTTILLGP
ncbi:MAG: hypothetical protein O2971_16325 [Proteobacteria bacterium]|nr:hypothetical protein [Pseudomonadota bacterium]